MQQFNLLISTSRYNENNAKAELWFILLALGDEVPLIFKADFSGLIVCMTNIEPKKCVKEIQKLGEKSSQLFQYILKITPIEFICETDLEIIRKVVLTNINKAINKDETFRITINKRNFETSKLDIIKCIAKDIDNKVDLKTPDKIINIEILGNLTGISFLEDGDILSVDKLR